MTPWVEEPDGTLRAVGPELETEVVPVPGAGRGRTVNVADVEPESVRWLWQGYVSFGMVTVIVGGTA